MKASFPAKIMAFSKTFHCGQSFLSQAGLSFTVSRIFNSNLIFFNIMSLITYLKTISDGDFFHKNGMYFHLAAYY
jgi:hypothetical protein